MKKKVIDIISPDQLQELRENGWVVIHREPIDDMEKAFWSGKFPEQVSARDGLNRAIAASIRVQNSG